MKMAKSRPNDENMSWLVTCQIINVQKPKLIDDENQLAYLTCIVNATARFNNLSLQYNVSNHNSIPTETKIMVRSK